MGTLPLFEDPSSFDRVKLAQKLRLLAEQGIYIGGSSWKYEGWIGQIYSYERYLSRGRFSQKRFQETCIQEYAETFPIVCGDFSFYQFPPDAFWQKLFSTAPAELKFAFKVPEEITVKCFPMHPRYGSRGGRDNDTFLNAEFFEASFLRPLRPYRDRIAVLMFEFGTFSKAAYAEPAGFFEDVRAFLQKLPADFHYAVEVRNQEFLLPEYFQVLREHSVAHVFNSWTRMPPLSAQIAMPEAFTADFTVARALLRPGRSYEEAVKLFSPYDSIKDENPQVRAAMKDILGRATRKRERAYLFVNNRLEGNSPITIEAIID